MVARLGNRMESGLRAHQTGARPHRSRVTTPSRRGMTSVHARIGRMAGIAPMGAAYRQVIGHGPPDNET